METAPKPLESSTHKTENPDPETIHDYEVLRLPEKRAEYLRLTDALIYRIVEQDTDVAIFLDKSARPVAWLIDELWDELAPATNASGLPTKKPQIKFLNIDREQWGAILGRSEDKDGGINIDMLPNDRLNELRALYKPIQGHSNEGDVSLLTDRKVLIVDEVKQSGDTLNMSTAILKRAFPDAQEIAGVYWMQSGTKTDQASGGKYGAEVPVWYSDREVTGRLVGNRDTSRSNQSNSYRQRVGRYWLSAPFREPDQKGRQLRKEVSWMAQDLRDHKLLYMPYDLWSDSFDPIENRIERLNGISIDEYVHLRREAVNTEELVDLYSSYIQDKKIS